MIESHILPSDVGENVPTLRMMLMKTNFATVSRGIKISGMDQVSHLQEMVLQTLLLSIELRESPRGAYLWTD